jgi:MFS family permease
MDPGRLVTRMADNLRSVYEEYPRQFWLLVGASFIDMVGNALIFPFFALFLTDHFDVDLTDVGVIFAIFSAAGIAGGTIGGALTDRFGRKPIAIFALVVSALSNLSIVLAPEFWMLYALAPVVGLVGSVGGPAWNAMMADLLPEKKRAEGFGLIRMMFNIAVMFGPMIGGLLAGVSYLLLFSVDAATSLITASILVVYLRETRPATSHTAGEADQPEETLIETFRGYRRVLTDRTFMAFMLLTTAAWLVYFQMNSTLPVYLRDSHGIQPTGFGMLLGLNAAMVVVMQFWFTRRLRGYAPMLVLASGVFLYAVGFGMFGMVSGAALFVLAMIIITVGEMIAVPVQQATAVHFAPEHMRGRYMAVLGFSSAIAGGSGTWLAGQISTHFGADWIWTFAGALGLLATAGYLVLHRYVDLPEFGTEEEPDAALDLAADAVADMAA